MAPRKSTPAGFTPIEVPRRDETALPGFKPLEVTPQTSTTVRVTEPAEKPKAETSESKPATKKTAAQTAQTKEA